MLKKEVEIINKLGLHARASGKFSQLANQYECEVWVSKGDKTINGKSIMGLMMLAASMGSTVEIKTFGIDEEAAMNALCNLIEEKFGEGE
ncbi:MAG: HPr family phosphocarrier protein [Neisseriaceae bacterium]|nr:HPr family phosphocarrier protein [Neisseriaceae bacterium]MBP5790146.1 HPr family phosphocarrier protein [Neisseriaceae bacterium]